MRKRLIYRVAASAACLGVGIVASLSAATPAQTYCPTTNEWPGSLVYAGIGNAVPAPWDDAIKTSMVQWNRVQSGGFGGVPGFTRLSFVTATGAIVSGNIFLDPGWTWKLDGTMNLNNQVADVRTITVHELGHELSLDHPSRCGYMTAAEQGAAMNPAGVTRWTTHADDKAGAAYMK